MMHELFSPTGASVLLLVVLGAFSLVFMAGGVLSARGERRTETVDLSNPGGTCYLLSTLLGLACLILFLLE